MVEVVPHVFADLSAAAIKDVFECFQGNAVFSGDDSFEFLDGWLVRPPGYKVLTMLVVLIVLAGQNVDFLDISRATS